MSQCSIRRVVALAVLCVIGLSACGGEQPPHAMPSVHGSEVSPDSSVPSPGSGTQTASGGETDVDNAVDASSLGRIRDAVQSASSGGGMVAYMDPRTVAVSSDAAAVVPEPIVNSDEVSREAGRYTLTTFCVGTGMLAIEFSVGEVSTESSLVCGDDLGSDLAIVDAGQSSGMTVAITPSAGTSSAIAYVVNRLSE